MPVSAPVSTERTTAQVDAQQRSHGEFIMSGSLTRLDPVREPDTQPVDLSAVIADFTQREEVYFMIKKLRESVSFWKRIQESSVDNAWENAQSFALPQHHLFIK